MNYKNNTMALSLFFTCLMTFLATSMNANAGEGVATFIEKSRVTLDVTYASKYIGQRGVDYFGNGSAIQPSMNIDLSDTGLYMGIWGATSPEKGCTDPFGDKCEDWVEYDFYAGHSATLLEGSPFKTTYDISYVYMYYPKQAKEDLHLVGLKFTHADLLPKLGPSKPSLYWGVSYIWTAERRGRDRKEFLLGLGYDVPVATQNINIFVDGVWDTGPGGSVNKNGLTRVRTGASTKFSWEGFDFKPAIYYQSKTKTTVPKSWIESEFWFKFSVSYSF